MKYAIALMILSLTACSTAPTVEEMMRRSYNQAKSGEEFNPHKVDGYDEWYAPKHHYRDMRDKARNSCEKK